MDVLTRNLVAAFTEIERRLQDFDPKKEVALHIFLNRDYHKKLALSYDLQTGDYSNRTEAKGKDLLAVSRELIRRAGFDEEQKNILLEPPKIEEEASAVEIPYDEPI